MEPAVSTQAKQATCHCNMFNQQEAADNGITSDGNQYCKKGKTVHTVWAAFDDKARHCLSFSSCKVVNQLPPVPFDRMA